MSNILDDVNIVESVHFMLKKKALIFFCVFKIHHRTNYTCKIFMNTVSVTFQEDMSDSAKVRSAKGPKLSKPFPEEAMPDFIRLLHANAHSKVFLTKEFGEFWRRQTKGAEPVGEGGADTPTPHAGHLISKRKILDKIQARWLSTPIVFKALDPSIIRAQRS